jgi:N-glycosylase/DNA lyase
VATKLNVFSLGQMVNIKEPDIRAQLVAYQLTLHGEEMWLAVWWVDSMRYSQWLYTVELKPLETVTK